MRRFLTRIWPVLSIAAAVIGGIFLDPAELTTSWWPTTEWAQHVATGFLIGIGGLVVGMVLGLLTGSFSFGGFQYDNSGQSGRADEVDEIRQKIAEVGNEQRAINQTAIEALTLARAAMDALTVRREG